VYETNPHTVKELRNNTCREVSTTSTRSGGMLSAYGQETNNFSISCSRDEFLLDFLKVIITAIICLAPFNDCSAFRDTVYEATLAELLGGTNWSSRKCSTIYEVEKIIILLTCHPRHFYVADPLSSNMLS
jgi:hypothetical protein